jgi:hypothetical protein
MTTACYWIIGLASFLFVAQLLCASSRSPVLPLHDFSEACRLMSRFTLSCVALCAISAAICSWSYCHAEEVKNGFRDTQWGQPPTPDMKPCDWRTNGPPTMWFVKKIGKRGMNFMVRANDRLQIGDVPLRAIEYLFVDNQLHLVRAFPKHRSDWDTLEELFTKQYGKPEENKEGGFAAATQGLANAKSRLWHPSDLHGVYFTKIGWYDKSAPYYVEFYDREFFENPTVETPPASAEQVKKDL